MGAKGGGGASGTRGRGGAGARGGGTAVGARGGAPAAGGAALKRSAVAHLAGLKRARVEPRVEDDEESPRRPASTVRFIACCFVVCRVCVL